MVRVHRLAGDSRPRGAVVKAGSGAWPSQWAICLWLAGGQLSKVGRRGGCLVLTPSLSNRLGISAPNNFVIDSARVCSVV